MNTQLPPDLSRIFNNTKRHLIDYVERTVRVDTEFGCAYYEVVGRMDYAYNCMQGDEDSVAAWFSEAGLLRAMYDTSGGVKSVPLVFHTHPTITARRLDKDDKLKEVFSSYDPNSPRDYLIMDIVFAKLNELDTILSPGDIIAYMNFYIRLRHHNIPVRYGGLAVYLPHKREIVFTFVDLDRMREELQRKLKHPINYTTDLESFSMQLIENHNKFLHDFFQKISEKKVKEVEQMVNKTVTSFIFSYPVYQISVNANIPLE